MLLLLLLVLPAQADELDTLLYETTRAGLSQYDLPQATRDLMLATDDQGRPLSFLKDCPICEPVMRAFRDYQPGGTLPPPAEWSSPDPLTRTSHVARSVRKWVTQRLKGEDPEVWADRFERAREEGRRLLKLYQAERVEAYKLMWSCLMCDAAVNGLRD